MQAALRRALRGHPVPLILLVACLLAFGITIPWLGLYADDWPFAYVQHVAGPRGVVDFISWVRPVAAYFFAAAAALVGTQFWAEHILLLLARWVDSLLLYGMLRRAWPERTLTALWAALLFVVFPAFKQSPLALEYLPHYTALGMLFGSLWASLRLYSLPEPSPRERAVLGTLAWLGSLQVFILEYFVGLELLRPLLVGIVLAQRMPLRQAAWKAARAWLPFLPVLTGFLVWRVFVIGFPSYRPELVSGLGSAPLAALRDLALAILHDLWTAGIAAWVQPFTALPGPGRTRLIWLGLVVASAIWFAVLLVWKGERTPQRARELDGSMALVGLFAMFAGGWPFWITRIPLALVFPWDRTSLAFMLGSCLLAAGLLDLLGGLLRPAFDRAGSILPPLVLAVMLAFSIGLHFQNANAFRKESMLLKNFYWQLSWRAPSLAPGTALILDQPPFNYHVDKFLSPLLNWTYAPGSRSLELPYYLFDFHKLWDAVLPLKDGSAPLQARYGTLSFNGDTARTLVVVYAPPGCLRVLTPAQSAHVLMTSELKQTLALTDLNLILPAPGDPAQPPAFLQPAPQDWCYYFEKADLAMQTGDSAGAARLGDEARAAGFEPLQPSEYLVFAAAYAKEGRWEDARSVSQAAASAGNFYRHAACVTWEQIARENPSTEAEAIIDGLQCP